MIACLEGTLSRRTLAVRDDMHIDGGRFAQEAVHRGQIEKTMETFDCGTSEDHLGDVFIFDDAGDSVRDVSPANPNHLRIQILSKLNICLERLLPGWTGVISRLTHDHV